LFVGVASYALRLPFKEMARRILIADDSPVIRRTIRTWIEAKTDCEVCGEASDGKTAVSLVERLKPDTVILDVAMPVMTGLQAADEIIAHAPKTQIIVLTNFSSDLLKQHAFRVGIKAVLAKDGESTLDRLVSTLENLPRVA
jgi:DNA-binding NarL/FixJ family response regulator